MKMYITPGGKSYRFERHALNRMAQRRIRQEDIEYVLDSYDTWHPDRKGNWCFIGELEDGRRLRVVVVKDSSPLTIITVVVLD